jgi:hypothetical protein
MSIKRLSPRAVWASLALGLITGCASSPQSAPQVQSFAAGQFGVMPAALGSAAGPVLPNAPLTGHYKTAGPALSMSGGKHYPKNGELLFVTQSDGSPPAGQIDVYTGVKTGAFKLAATITDSIYSPGQIATDSSGTLYVSSPLGVYVTEFPNGSTLPTKEIADGLTEPSGVVIDSNDTLYVSNQTGPASIVEYLKGSSTPSATITSSMFGILVGLALDPSGNLYVSDDVKHQVFEVPAGSTTPQSLFLEGLSDYSCSQPYGPAGLAFDKRGRLYVSCPEGNRILVYKLPKVTPIATLTNGMNEPYFLSFDPRGVLFVANYGGGNIEMLAPPDYTTILGTLGGYANPVGAFVRPKL